MVPRFFPLRFLRPGRELSANPWFASATAVKTLLRFVKKKMARRGKDEPEDKAGSGMLILVVVALFAGLDGDGQVIPLRRERTGRVGTESTRRILRLVEVQRRLAVDRLVRIEESARDVGIARVGGIAEDDEERSVVIQDGVQ